MLALINRKHAQNIQQTSRRLGNTAKRALKRASRLVYIRVNQCDVVIAGDAVSKRRQALIDALYHHFVWQTVPNMLQLCRNVNYVCDLTETWKAADITNGVTSRSRTSRKGACSCGTKAMLSSPCLRTDRIHALVGCGIRYKQPVLVACTCEVDTT